MTAFVLVHGAFHGGWCWDDVVARLEAAGHTAHAPTLFGLAERADTAGRTVSLRDHVEEVVTLIEQADLRDVVLVGHSLGGMVVTAVADRCRDRIARLVYLGAFVPVSGQSARDFIPEAMYAGALQAVHLLGGGTFLPVIFPVAKFVDYEGAAAAQFMARLTSQPFLTFVEPVFLRHPPVARRTFIYCSKVPFGLFDDFAKGARSAEGWTYVDLPTSHDAMILEPEAVTHHLMAD